jgi:DUF1680 family protein
MQNLVTHGDNHGRRQVIERAWKSGDTVGITLPMKLQIETSKTISSGGAPPLPASGV